MLLKTQSASSRKLVPTSSSSTNLFHWFAASSQTVEDVDK
ncbi:hypothetical protein KP509_20G073800 [Ceratopteris richardii]|nr:hypothetical protein KP509_20G073800 [Ceratopteris richardii]